MPPIPTPLLCLVTDRRAVHLQDEQLVERVYRAVRGGVSMVQLRERDLPGGELLKLAERLRESTEGTALLFVNDRVDVALACGADGVQLGEAGLDVGAARRVAGNSLLVGRSVHSVEGAAEAEREGADFLVVGTIYPTSSHHAEEPAGPQLLARIASRVATPFVGIGGINAANVGEVVEAGASGVAVISAILTAKDPEAAASQLKMAIDAAWRSSPVGRAGERR